MKKKKKRKHTSLKNNEIKHSECESAVFESVLAWNVFF